MDLLPTPLQDLPTVARPRGPTGPCRARRHDASARNRQWGSRPRPTPMGPAHSAVQPTPTVLRPRAELAARHNSEPCQSPTPHPPKGSPPWPCTSILTGALASTCPPGAETGPHRCPCPPPRWIRGLAVCAPTGIQDVVNATVLNRSSLYAAFGGKQQLYLAALRRYVEQWSRPAFSAWRRTSGACPPISGFFAELIYARCDGEYARWGCMIANALAGAENGDPRSGPSSTGGTSGSATPCAWPSPPPRPTGSSPPQPIPAPPPMYSPCSPMESTCAPAPEPMLARWRRR